VAEQRAGVLLEMLSESAAYRAQARLRQAASRESVTRARGSRFERAAREAEAYDEMELAEYEELFDPELDEGDEADEALGVAWY
ncbi:MAG TPA: hypothetical protein VKW77_06555, partial [Acidimicrobiales bacterium]|nr:hypothetical protein [Acidimicrobiales bacterium]